MWKDGSDVQDDKLTSPSGPFHDSNFKSEGLRDPYHGPNFISAMDSRPLAAGDLDPKPNLFPKVASKPVALSDLHHKPKVELILCACRNFPTFIKDIWSLALNLINALCSVVNATSALMCFLVAFASLSYMRPETALSAPQHTPPTESTIISSVQTRAEVALERCLFQALSDFFRQSLIALPALQLAGLMNDA